MSEFNNIYFVVTTSSFGSRFIEAATYLSASSTFSFIAKSDGSRKLLINSASLDENNLLSNSEVSFNITNIFTTSSAVISSSNQILKLSGIKFKVEPLIEIFRINQSPSYAKLAIAQDGAFFNCYFEGGGFTSSYNLTRQV